MNKEFVPFDVAFKLKELGFDEPCFGRYDGDGKNKGKIWYEMPNSGQDTIPVGDVLAPLFQQVFRWFRDKYGLKHDIDDDNKGDKFYYKIKSITDKFDNYDDVSFIIRKEKDWSKIELSSYEDAEIECIKKLIEIVKK
jgi:hypothetical protein